MNKKEKLKTGILSAFALAFTLVFFSFSSGTRQSQWYQVEANPSDPNNDLITTMIAEPGADCQAVSEDQCAIQLNLHSTSKPNTVSEARAAEAANLLDIDGEAFRD